MKAIPTAIKLMAVAAVFIGLFASHASAANNPIPGIDVVVRKQPAGSAIKATADKEGRFTFAGLKAGTYILSVTPPNPAKAPVATSRSNKKQAFVLPGIENGQEVIKVVVAVVPAKEGERDEPITVKVLKDGIKIVGAVYSSDTPEDIAKLFRIEGHLGRP